MKIFSNSPYLTKKNVFGLYRHEIGIKVRISVEFVISSCHVQKIKATQIIFETILNFYSAIRANVQQNFKASYLEIKKWD